MLSPGFLSSANAGAEPEVMAAQAAVSGQLVSALTLLRQMVGSNMKTLQIARQLMLAQDLAERHRSRVGPVVDEAAASGGEHDAIERAVRTVAAADAADEEEWALSQEWASHIYEVNMLTEKTDNLFAQSLIALEPEA
ncbi:MAG TPA: hypothetical protein VG325_20165 [Solirubrobacteraceae bacterium]|jgi:thioesterase domain-containing protein|nr:hypothetical protein [Solirubrobacteraceae bacterium]